MIYYLCSLQRDYVQYSQSQSVSLRTCGHSITLCFKHCKTNQAIDAQITNPLTLRDMMIKTQTINLLALSIYKCEYCVILFLATPSNQLQSISSKHFLLPVWFLTVFFLHQRTVKLFESRFNKHIALYFLLVQVNVV